MISMSYINFSSKMFSSLDKELALQLLEVLVEIRYLVHNNQECKSVQKRTIISAIRSIMLHATFPRKETVRTEGKNFQNVILPVKQTKDNQLSSAYLSSISAILASHIFWFLKRLSLIYIFHERRFMISSFTDFSKL